MLGVGVGGFLFHRWAPLHEGALPDVGRALDAVHAGGFEVPHLHDVNVYVSTDEC